MDGEMTRRERVRAGMEDPSSHGRSGYSAGCRCVACREAQRVAVAHDRARRRTLPVHRIPHGESGYVNYDCRCEVCRAAGSHRNRRAFGKRMATSGRRRQVYRWTPDQDAVLRRDDLTAAQVAELVGRTEYAVFNRRKRLRAAARAKGE